MPDAKIRVREVSKRGYRYPDASVFCGPQLHPGTTSLFTNPKILFEVLSESTKDIDMEVKLEAYTQLPSLEAYVIIHQEERRGVVHRRASGGWRSTSYRAGRVELPGAPVSLDLDELYREAAPAAGS